MTDPTADAQELIRLREESAALRAQLDLRHRRAAALVALRRVAAAVLVPVAALSFIVSIIGLWAATTTLNTDRWVAAVAPLPKKPEVSAAVADYATTQVFRVLDVDQRVKAALPDSAAFLAGPLTTQIRDHARNTVNNVLQSDRFQPVWIETNRRAHQRALAISEGRSEVVSVQAQSVEIDLLPLINQALRELSSQLPTLFGRQVSLPDLNSGEIPVNLRTRIEDAVGVTLPANFAQFTIYDGDRLSAMQQALVRFKRDLALFVIGTLALIALAFVISPGRRRTLLQSGIWLVIGAVAVTATVRAVRTQLLAQVPEGLYRDGASAAITTLTSTLRQRGVQTIWIGATLAVVAYLAGPGRGAVWVRRNLVAAARWFGRAASRVTSIVVARGPSWIARHRDPIRVAGVVVAAVVALVLSSWTGLLVVIVVLGIYETAVTVIGRDSVEGSAPRAT